MENAKTDNMIQILQGDCRDVLKTLPDESVQCVVTSPPYWGLRDYGVDNQIGLEKTPQEYVATMVQVFREVRRVLKQDGTCWLNLGDSYARQAGDDSTKSTDSGMKTGRTGKSELLFKDGNNVPPAGLKPKDLVGIPWRVAFALQDDGWWLRSDIIWSKPNPMPESVTDRPTRAHEYIFLLTKSPKYFYDADAIREPASEATIARLNQDIDSQDGSERANGGEKTNGAMKAVIRLTDKQRGHSRRHSGFNDRWDKMTVDEQRALGANKRSVWTVAPANYKDAHFATFPPALISPCILAGSRAGDTVLDPFGGSGTTGQVALGCGRKAILIELNPEYHKMIEKRTQVLGFQF